MGFPKKEVWNKFCRVCDAKYKTNHKYSKKCPKCYKKLTKNPGSTGWKIKEITDLMIKYGMKT